MRKRLTKQEQAAKGVRRKRVKASAAETMPPAGPHARPALTDREKTPGTGALPKPTPDDESDPGTG